MQTMRQMVRLTALCATMVAAAAEASAARLTGPLVMMPVKMLDTSGEGGDHTARQDALSTALAASWAGATGSSAGPQVTTEAISAACPDAGARCLLDLAARQGSDGPAAFLVVQKTSTLILTLYVSIVDPATGRLIARRELSFRGDNDTAWTRAGSFAGRSLATAAAEPGGAAGGAGQSAASPSSGAHRLPAPPANPPATPRRH